LLSVGAKGTALGLASAAKLNGATADCCVFCFIAASSTTAGAAGSGLEAIELEAVEPEAVWSDSGSASSDLRTGFAARSLDRESTAPGPKTLDAETGPSTDDPEATTVDTGGDTAAGTGG
jgi:hypothetical protein